MELYGLSKIVGWRDQVCQLLITTLNPFFQVVGELGFHLKSCILTGNFTALGNCRQKVLTNFTEQSQGLLHFHKFALILSDPISPQIVK